MKDKDYLLWLGLGALLIATTVGAGVAAYKMTRGLRNNNPGNIRHSSSQWKGMSTIQTDIEFVQFDNPVYGIRALAKILTNYQDKYGLNTVRQIINRWAPPTENDTGAYVNHVAKVIGVNPDAPVNVRENMEQLVSAIIKHENGLNPYASNVIKQGIGLV